MCSYSAHTLVFHSTLHFNQCSFNHSVVLISWTSDLLLVTACHPKDREIDSQIDSQIHFETGFCKTRIFGCSQVVLGWRGLPLIIWRLTWCTSADFRIYIGKQNVTCEWIFSEYYLNLSNFKYRTEANQWISEKTSKRSVRSTCLYLLTLCL